MGIIFPRLLLSSKGQGRETAEWAKHFSHKLEDQSSDPKYQETAEWLWQPVSKLSCQAWGWLGRDAHQANGKLWFQVTDCLI